MKETQVIIIPRSPDCPVLSRTKTRTLVSSSSVLLPIVQTGRPACPVGGMLFWWWSEWKVEAPWFIRPWPFPNYCTIHAFRQDCICVTNLISGGNALRSRIWNLQRPLLALLCHILQECRTSEWRIVGRDGYFRSAGLMYSTVHAVRVGGGPDFGGAGMRGRTVELHYRCMYTSDRN
jgi:hypothetical protein